MKKNLEAIRTKVINLLMSETEKLLKKDYLEVLEEVGADIDGFIDAVRQELENEEE